MLRPLFHGLWRWRVNYTHQQLQQKIAPEECEEINHHCWQVADADQAVRLRLRERPAQCLAVGPSRSIEQPCDLGRVSRRQVVGVINLQNRLAHTHTRREIKLISTTGFLVGAEIEAARLDGEISQLSEQLETRKLVERAKGILQRELGVSEEDAYLTLQRQSRQRRRPMKEVAEAIVLSEEVKRVQRHS